MCIILSEVDLNLCLQGSSLIGEVWRMLHSAAGQLEYIISIGRSLQDLVRFILEIKQVDAKRDPPQPTPDVEKKQSKLDTLVSSAILRLTTLISTFYIT